MSAAVYVRILRLEAELTNLLELRECQPERESLLILFFSFTLNDREGLLTRRCLGGVRWLQNVLEMYDPLRRLITAFMKFWLSSRQHRQTLMHQWHHRERQLNCIDSDCVFGGNCACRENLDRVVINLYMHAIVSTSKSSYMSPIPSSYMVHERK